MSPFNAIFASSVNPERCEYRVCLLDAISETNPAMEKIDREWIRKRLDRMPRGSQSRLAEHLGIPQNAMSKIMSGVREIQQDEVTKVLSFFKARIVTENEMTEDQAFIMAKAEMLNDDGLALLKAHLDQLLTVQSLRRPAEDASPAGEPDAD